MTNTITEVFGEPIFAYTRAQAIEDGFLHDVTEIAKIAGFAVNTVVSAGVMGELQKGADFAIGQMNRSKEDALDVMLLDALIKAAMAVNTCDPKTFDPERVEFRTHMAQNHNQKEHMEAGRFELSGFAAYLHLGVGDGGEPVATIMLPHED